MDFEQQALPTQPAQGSGETIWSLFWYVMKWVFFVVLIYMGMKYFYDMNRKKQAADLAAQKEKEEEEKEETNED